MRRSRRHREQAWGPLADGTFNPATLSLTGWWRASYTAPGANPRWTGTASAGGSASEDLNQDTDGNPVATVGAAVNSLDPADFEPAGNQALETENNASTYFTAAAGSAAILTYVETASAPSAGVNTDEAIFSTPSQRVFMTITTNGVRAVVDDGAYKATAAIACSTGAWHLLQMKWNGTNVYCRVDSTAWQSTAAGNVASLAVKIVFAKQPGVAFTDLRIADIMFASTALSDATFDNIKSYVNSRYALSL